MSITNGSNKKRNNKRNGSLTTAAVYPIIQNVQKEDPLDDVDISASTKNDCKKNKKTSVNISYGQKIIPQSVPYVIY